MKYSSCEILNACYNLDQERFHSNIKRAQKYECETQIDYPKGFFDKSTLHQAKVTSALLKKKLLERRLKDWQEQGRIHGHQLRTGGQGQKCYFLQLEIF